jgi:signal transduction histidine kinase
MISEAERVSGRIRGVKEPWTAHLLALLCFMVISVLIASEWPAVVRIVMTDWPILVFWSVLVAVVNFFPLSVGDLQLTLDMPLLLAVALLYPVEVAALVTLLAAMDQREIRRQVSLSRAVFNRCQVALTVWLAGVVLGALGTDLENWPFAIGGALVALASSYVANVLLVSLFTALRTSVTWRESLFSVTVGRAKEFLATYAGYGVLAVVLARLSADVGAWSVATFLVPTLVARQMLVKGRALEQVTARLRNRERILEKLSERVVDERRDERSRVATELHDDVVQTLTRVWLEAKRLERHADEGTALRGQAQEVAALSDATLVSMRDVMNDLRRSPLGRGGLLPTVRAFIRDLQLDWQRSIQLSCHLKGDLSPEAQVTAYQVVREGAINALKHSAADEISVTLGGRDSDVVIEVCDNGVGFTPSSVDESKHFGLGLLRERVAIVGGRMTIDSDPGKGTRLRAVLPLRVP